MPDSRAVRVALVALSPERRARIAAALGAGFQVTLETEHLIRAAHADVDLIVVDGDTLESVSLVGYAVLALDAEPGTVRALRLAAPRAWGALEPSADANALRSAARAVASGLIALSPGLAPLAALETDAASDLTERELEVLALLFEGWSNKRIAAELRLAPSTVKFHLEGIYTKLEVRSRAQAVRRALELRLVSL
jgi:DNA-binding NarL/FixJ family response regulator